ncbi:uncharacterized protein LOC142987730 [Anticarsia gemmatalis]|uniref:uncharacterized protein LOC142987730 n=1 Tax=Anticarsia gemmatalis TaxID=129554 RepID=UPI003F775723
MPSSSAAPRAADTPGPHGGVELREDVPLKLSAGGGGGAGGVRGTGARCCGDGPRLIPAAFAALSACITLALVTQIYCGDYEVVPHGSVASSAAACSRAGTDALKAGGRALDAALAAALCLAVVAPHRTSLDASGSLLYWEYRESRTQQPSLYEWGAASVEGAEEGAPAGERAPRLVAALAHLHARLGVLPWPRLLAPAIQLASEGFPVSEGLSTVAADSYPAGTNSTAPELALYLRSLLSNTSSELAAAWNSSALVREMTPARAGAGGWRMVAGGAGAGAALRALTAALQPPPASPDDAQLRVVSALQREALAAGADGVAPSGVATGLAAVDRRDTYVALVTGVSVPFGSGPATSAGWRRDAPAAPLDLAPALLLDAHVCGSRFVVGAESTAALAQAGAALAAGGAAAGVERARVAVLAGGALALEAAREPPAPLPPALPPLPLRNASLPYAAVNLVLQRGDALTSHADSRGGGLASRF